MLEKCEKDTMKNRSPKIRFEANPSIPLPIRVPFASEPTASVKQSVVSIQDVLHVWNSIHIESTVLLIENNELYVGTFELHNEII